MYCPIDERDKGCPSICCRLYNLALGFLAVLIVFIIGLLLGAYFSFIFIKAFAILVASAIILAIIFIVTLITRGCCEARDD